MTYTRPSRIDNWLEQARIVAKMGTCLRRRYGAIIVKDNILLSQGYCGAARGLEDCLERGYCLREQLKIPSGERYELCRSVHAENNAIINAAIAGVSIIRATLYLCGEESQSRMLADAAPCSMCARAIINARLEKVIAKVSKISNDNSGIRIYTLNDLKEIAESF